MATVKKLCLHGDKSNLININQEGTLADGFNNAVSYMAGDWNNLSNWTKSSWTTNDTNITDDKELNYTPNAFISEISTNAPVNKLSSAAKTNYFYPTSGVGSYDVNTLYLSPDIGMRTIQSENSTTTDGKLQSVLHGQFPSTNSSIAEVGQLKLYKNMTYSQAIAVLTSLYKALIQRPYIFENISQVSTEQNTIADLGNQMPFINALTSENNLVNNNYEKVIKSVYSKNATNELTDFDTTAFHMPLNYNCSLGAAEFFQSDDYNMIANKVDSNNSTKYYSSYFSMNTSYGEIEWPSDGDTYIDAIEYLTRTYKIVNANLPKMAEVRIQH